jgi:hypothetical protein
MLSGVLIRIHCSRVLGDLRLGRAAFRLRELNWARRLCCILGGGMVSLCCSSQLHVRISDIEVLPQCQGVAECCG